VLAAVARGGCGCGHDAAWSGVGCVPAWGGSSGGTPGGGFGLQALVGSARCWVLRGYPCGVFWVVLLPAWGIERIPVLLPLLPLVVVGGGGGWVWWCWCVGGGVVVC
jgi:hypothetical protein